MKTVIAEITHVLDNLFCLQADSKFHAFLLENSRLGLSLMDYAISGKELRGENGSCFKMSDYEASLIAQLDDYETFCHDNNISMDTYFPLLECTKEDFNWFKRGKPYESAYWETPHVINHLDSEYDDHPHVAILSKLTHEDPPYIATPSKLAPLQTISHGEIMETNPPQDLHGEYLQTSISSHPTFDEDTANCPSASLRGTTSNPHTESYDYDSAPSF